MNIISILLSLAWCIIGGYAFFDAPKPYPGHVFVGAQTETKMIINNSIGAILWIVCQVHYFTCAKKFQ